MSLTDKYVFKSDFPIILDIISIRSCINPGRVQFIMLELQVTQPRCRLQCVQSTVKSIMRTEFALVAAFYETLQSLLRKGNNNKTTYQERRISRRKTTHSGPSCRCSHGNIPESNRKISQCIFQTRPW